MRLRVQITHRNLGKEGGSHSIPHAPSGALTDLAGGRREEWWPPAPSPCAGIALHVLQMLGSSGLWPLIFGANPSLYFPGLGMNKMSPSIPPQTPWLKK